MVYLEYDIRTKQVVEIHDAEPTVTTDYDFAKSEQFAVGDEFEQTIWINEVDENKNVISYSAIRNNPQAKRLLQENAELKANQAILEQAILELTTLIAGGSN